METREQMGGAYEGVHAVLDALVVLQRAAHGLTGGSTWSDRRVSESDAAVFESPVGVLEEAARAASDKLAPVLELVRARSDRPVTVHNRTGATVADAVLVVCESIVQGWAITIRYA